MASLRLDKKDDRYVNVYKPNSPSQLKSHVTLCVCDVEYGKQNPAAKSDCMVWSVSILCVQLYYLTHCMNVELQADPHLLSET